MSLLEKGNRLNMHSVCTVWWNAHAIFLSLLWINGQVDEVHIRVLHWVIGRGELCTWNGDDAGVSLQFSDSKDPSRVIECWTGREHGGIWRWWMTTLPSMHSKTIFYGMFGCDKMSPTTSTTTSGPTMTISSCRSIPQEGLDSLPRKDWIILCLSELHDCIWHGPWSILF